MLIVFVVSVLLTTGSAITSVVRFYLCYCSISRFQLTYFLRLRTLGKRHWISCLGGNFLKSCHSLYMLETVTLNRCAMK